MPEHVSWLSDGPSGLEVIVHVRPGAARSAIVGLHDGALCVRVAARAVEGEANRELLRILAEALGVRASALTLRRGVRSREKRVVVAGTSSAALVAKVAPLLR